MAYESHIMNPIGAHCLAATLACIRESAQPPMLVQPCAATDGMLVQPPMMLVPLAVALQPATGMQAAESCHRPRLNLPCLSQGERKRRMDSMLQMQMQMANAASGGEGSGMDPEQAKLQAAVARMAMLSMASQRQVRRRSTLLAPPPHSSSLPPPPSSSSFSSPSPSFSPSST